MSMVSSWLKCNQVSESMSTIPEDLLVEIFYRLPNAHSAIQSASVCKRWNSLIMNPHFRERFTQHHSRRKYSDFRILFKCSSHTEVPHFQLPLKDLENEPDPYNLTFMPDPASLEIKTACGDLLLVGRARKPGIIYKPIIQYYICNSRTRSWCTLPKIPEVEDFHPRVPTFQMGSYGFAIVPDPRNHHRYRVLVVYMSYFVGGKFMFCTVGYDPESAEWVTHRFFIPHESPDSALYDAVALNIIVADNGTVYWLDGLYELHGVAAFDPFTNQFRWVQFPSDQFSGITPVVANDKVRLGMVQGCLRISQLRKINDFCFGLTIWELGDGGDSWGLVHDVSMETRGMAVDVLLFFVLAFDPNDRNSVFLVRDKDIYRYRIDEDFHERVCEFPNRCFSLDCNGLESVEKIKESVAKCLNVSTIVHPLWPTPISLFEHHRT